MFYSQGELPFQAWVALDAVLIRRHSEIKANDLTVQRPMLERGNQHIEGQLTGLVHNI